MIRRIDLTKHSPLGERIADLARGWQLLAATVILVAVVLVIAPQQAGLIVYKAALITGAAILAYYVDRVVFPYARPDSDRLTDTESVHAQYRRVIIIASAMLAAGLAA